MGWCKRFLRQGILGAKAQHLGGGYGDGGADAHAKRGPLHQKSRVRSSERCVAPRARIFLLWRPADCSRRAAESDKWVVIPQDLEDSFATDSRDGYRNCAAEGYACKVRQRKPARAMRVRWLTYA